MYKNLKFLLLFISLIFSACFGFSQSKEDWCGTYHSEEFDAYSSGLLLQRSLDTINCLDDYTCVEKSFSVSIHIVRDSLGDAGISEALIEGTFNSMNSIFEPICMDFNICAYEYIDNYNFDIVNRGNTEEEEMIILHNVPNTINVYYVEEFENPGGICGYAYFPGGEDVVVIKKSCPDWDVLTHEFGHFFGLYHTFETDFGVELANGSNCVSAGDLICDTEADDNGGAQGCVYTGAGTDTNGEYLTPPVGNIMSYYNCACEFTPQQYAKMVEMYRNFRTNLY